MKLCITTRFCGKTFFAPKNGEMGQKLPNTGCFEFKEKFGFSVFILYWKVLLDPRNILLVAGRVQWNRICPSFRPSFRLSGRFRGIVSLIFLKFWIGARIPCEVVRDRAGFSGKIFFAPKIGKMGPNWAQNRLFSIYWKIWSLIFTAFDLQWKFTLFSVFLNKSHI